MTSAHLIPLIAFSRIKRSQHQSYSLKGFIVIFMFGTFSPNTNIFFSDQLFVELLEHIMVNLWGSIWVFKLGKKVDWLNLKRLVNRSKIGIPD